MNAIKPARSGEGGESASHIEQAIAEINRQLLIETKIKIGAETMLAVAEKTSKGTTVPRIDVLQQLEQTNKKIDALNQQLQQYEAKKPGREQDKRAKGRERSGSTPSEPQAVLGKSLKRIASLNMLSSGKLADTTAGADSSRSSMNQLRERRSEGNIINNDPPFSIHTILAGLQNRSLTEEAQLSGLDDLVYLIKSSPSLTRTVPVDIQILSVMRYLQDVTKPLRAAAYRCLRYLSRDVEAVEIMVKYHVELYIQRTLTKETKKLVEKEQCLRLVRTWIELPHSAGRIPLSIVRMIIALADHADDKFRLVAIETLAEMALSPHLPTVAQCGGVRSLCMGLLDCPRDMTEYLAMTLLALVDRPEFRCYVRPGVDIEAVVSVFSDAYSRGNLFEEKLAAAARALAALLHHWPGILYLCQDGSRVVRAIVDSLRLSYDDIRLAVLNLLQGLFHVYSPSPDSSHPDRLDLVGHATAFVLLIFVQAGLLESLIDLIGQSPSQAIMTTATALIGHLIELCNQLLPEHVAVAVQSLPGLFDLASRFRQREQIRHRAIAALAHIDESTTGVALAPPSSPTTAETDTGTTPLRVPAGAAAARADQVKALIGLAMDDAQVRALLHESGVLGAKAREYTKWSWPLLVELFQGPLMIPRRIDEVLRTTKFFKRMCSFYLPSKRLFCDLPMSKSNAIYIKVGTLIMTSLLSSSDGVNYLKEHRLLHELAGALTSLDPNRGVPDWQQILTAARLERTLTLGYFTILGSMTKSDAGVLLLNQFRFFSLFYHLSELIDRPDIMRILIVSLDYAKDGHCRTLLSKFLSCAVEEVRLFATHHLRSLLKQHPSGTPTDLEWLLRLLSHQLYDPAEGVYRAAVTIFDEACHREVAKQILVDLQPTLEHLGDAAQPLLMRVLSTSPGFRYLRLIGYIEREYERWCTEACVQYVEKMELTLFRRFAKSLRSTSPFERGRYEDLFDDGWTIAHFFGELAKTPEGCQLIRDRGHFAEACRQLQAWDDKAADVLQLKAYMWLIGHVGSSKTGVAFIDQCDVLIDLSDIACEADTLSLRGTAFHVLGLIAKTPKGRGLLYDHGWECDGEHGFCVPAELADMTKIAPWKYKGSHPLEHLDLASVVDVSALDAVAREILEHVANLSNHILLNGSLKTLARLRTQHPAYFQSFELYQYVGRLLSAFNFRYSSRKFIQDLFDRVEYRATSSHRRALVPPPPPPTAATPTTATRPPPRRQQRSPRRNRVRRH
ncbi:hypothetical protein AMAG_04335 [Allomyces macrogynus ATCC 38327]|uniref:REM-1 domain-containing protein n=1 Tax=Allomyces macrogynus (strain ATCC 38327) TaxID=578462 RepID=A0A0L0S852_ALLM3|nr:hypothetical protein AMAG_04335 [Allomyces macrogynus ATCC 38327]|eukprot:KNE58783.1 hypothetical protein AMAG_04335 [Allomyces macrogynus ATCC 38327]